MNQPASDTHPARAPYPLWRRLVKIALWTVMGIVLAVAGLLVCVVSTLSPEKLTPLVLRVANESLDADVSASRVEMSLRPSFPFLNLKVDSLCIVSHAFDGLPADSARRLPAYADTLVSIGRLTGGISLASLLKGDINLSDITLDYPAINIVTGPDNRANYMIAKQGSRADTTALKLPAIRLSRFELHHPLPIRYCNCATDRPDSLEVYLTPDPVLAHMKTPVYNLKFAGNLHMPMLGEFNLWELPFSFDGDLSWNPAEPFRLQFSNFSAGVAFAHSVLSADVDFADQLLLHSLDLTLDPVRLDALLSCLPDSIRRTMPVLRQLRTDAALGMDVHLTRPFNTLTDTIPYAEVNLTMAPCRLDLGRSSMHDVEARLHATLRGNDLSAATVNVERVHVAGPATALTLTGNLSDLGADPCFDGRLEGYSDLGRLPDQLMNLLAGSMRGSLKLDLRVSGRPSMFGRDSFHLLRASGQLHGHDVYWLGNDTVRAAYARNIDFDFGTQDRTTRIDSLLHAVVKIDTVSFLDHVTDVRVTGFSLGVAAENSSTTSDTTIITPMGGGLKVASLRVQNIIDSVGMMARNLHGRIVMRRFNGHTRRPEFLLNMGIGRIGVGSPDARFLITDAAVQANAHEKPRPARSNAIRRTADSLHTIHPELPLDSVYIMAIEMHRRGKHRPRVHPEITASDREIIEWGASRGLSRLLTGWVLQGTVKARRAGLYAAAFPLRNRVRNLNVKFNTDSVIINDVQYKVGHSDFTVNGRITNMSRAFTSKTGKQSLRVNLELVSDTIDVNQLAAATFAGAAYSQHKARRMAHGLRSFDLDADTLNLDRLLSHAADTITGPLLLPSNIDAELHMRANNIIYSDLLLHKFYGDALMANGHLNFHRLTASSDMGSVDLNALYSAPTPDNMQFGFGLRVNDFNIERFLDIVPAIDSLMPLMRDISGIIDANIAATVDVDSNMNLVLPTLNAAVHLQGDSLRLLDGKTFDTLAKWLLFKDKQSNMIDSMSVELLIDKGMMEIFPFVFNFDRYRLGVQGYNDMALNFNYKIAVLKSPIPFKFGITLKGNPDKFSVRLGRARFNEKTAIERPAIVDTTRVNLLRQIEGVFRRGVTGSRMTPLRFDIRPQAQTIDLSTDTLTRADSLLLQREGLIPAQ